ncbi:MAG: ATP-binding protein, partial [Paracoccaceae bacterium]|nr:ATP-binding protein [Paracoccaceae bacterium]
DGLWNFDANSLRMLFHNRCRGERSLAISFRYGINGIMRQNFLAILFLVGVLVLTGLVWIYSAVQSIEELEQRGQADLELASDRLVGKLVGFRQLTVTLASDPRIGSQSTSLDEIVEILTHATDISGALNLVLLDRDPTFIASALNWPLQDWTGKAFVERAFRGALGWGVFESDTLNRRAFAYAVPVFSNIGPVSRVLVAVLDIEEIEAEFRGSNPVVFMTNASGVIYFSNRSELVLRDRYSSVSDGDADDDGAAPGFVDYQAYDLFGFDVWSVSAGRYLPSLALRVERDLPVIGMHAEALIDLRPALSTAWLQSAFAGVFCLLMGAAIFLVANQRRILAQANIALETRVAARTQELSEVNETLRAEVGERKEAEKALRRAQKELVQAGKLSALGKMSAGISHELNQPLMAIRSFSDNSAKFLARGNTEAAIRNVAKISDLAERMARIIRNFRAFARQEKERVKRVDLAQVVRSAIEVVADRLDGQQVEVQLNFPNTPVWVQGGEVRLQQVVLNLLSNAIDAMSGLAEQKITVAVQIGPLVTLEIHDTGPGIEEPEKAFEPFYSTKEIGEAEGVGLGLSISYGLVQSFGGNIRGQNDPNGGAIFTVELQPWTQEADK